MIVLSNCMSAQSVALFTMQIYFSGMFLIVFKAVAYAADYRLPNVLRVELLTRKSYERGTCTS